MNSLPGKAHWDSVYASMSDQFVSAPPLTPDAPERAATRHALWRQPKAALREFVREYGQTYDEYVLWNDVVPKHLPDLAGQPVIEVGSAPGDFLVTIKERFGCIPYGVEYSETGVALNRRIFEANGIDPSHVFHADVFSDDFQRDHAGRYRAVFSRAFLDHYADGASVVESHLALLAPGGTLWLEIPNLRGINHLLMKAFNPERLALHNTEVMPLETFASLFDSGRVSQSFCGYFGVLNFYLVSPPEPWPLEVAVKLLHRVQPLLNMSFRATLRHRSADNGWTSPFLLFIGTKTG